MVVLLSVSRLTLQHIIIMCTR